MWTTPATINCFVVTTVIFQRLQKKQAKSSSSSPPSSEVLPAQDESEASQPAEELSLPVTSQLGPESPLPGRTSPTARHVPEFSDVTRPAQKETPVLPAQAFSTSSSLTELKEALGPSTFIPATSAPQLEQTAAAAPPPLNQEVSPASPVLSASAQTSQEQVVQLAFFLSHLLFVSVSSYELFLFFPPYFLSFRVQFPVTTTHKV